MSKGNNGRDTERTPEEQVRASADEHEDGMPEPGSSASADPGTTETDPSDAAGTVEQLEHLQGEVALLKDQLLRKQADFENFRKRMVRERTEAAKYANSSLLTDLVEVIDNFERAIKSSEDSRDYDNFHEGIALIEKQFTSMLESKWGLKRFDSTGEEFDPEKHQAIAAEESEEVETQTVAEDYQKGYLLHERVLRPAKVKVFLPASPSGSQPESNEESNDKEKR